MARAPKLAVVETFPPLEVSIDQLDAELLVSILIDAQDSQATNHPEFSEDFAVRVARVRHTIERALRAIR